MASVTSCHGTSADLSQTFGQILLIGAPNVGKSLIFHRLTGQYATVSNYPGTTVEITTGCIDLGEGSWQLADTPGIRSFQAPTEEERVAKRLLVHNRPALLIHVVDAKDLKRELSFTIQLLDLGIPVILVLNMMDEAERLGLQIDSGVLERRLGIRVVQTRANSAHGIDDLREAIRQSVLEREAPDRAAVYDADTEARLDAICKRLRAAYPVSKRFMAALLLHRDAEIASWVREIEGESAAEELAAQVSLERMGGQPPHVAMILRRYAMAAELSEAAMRESQVEDGGLRARLSQWTVSPLLGVPILLLVLYALYLFVGLFGAQTAVEFLEETLFSQQIESWIKSVVQAAIPWAPLQDLLAGEYGVLTLGLRYAFAIILPIIATFFLAFAVIEDSGYLPRLSMLIDRLFKGIGLSGRAVIPMILGFGCDTMATLVSSRTLETKRERVIATMLLALAVPCSAQLGIILALLLSNPFGLWIWAVVVAGNFLFIGFLTSRILPGERSFFFIEIPPLRVPQLGNVLMKTIARVHWYLKEIIPFFLIASVVIWIGQITHLFQLMVDGLTPVVQFIGLPAEAAIAFLFGFFRRDYGAAGLYDLHQSGLLTGIPLVVAAVTLTLFIPCIAQFAITVKERGWKMALGMAAFIFPYAFFVGWLLHEALTQLKVIL